ncbi:Uncharacterised protein [Chlamydia trachomatis]|nr:Uncharacterised protein [Chlamydia trachomatis]
MARNHKQTYSMTCNRCGQALTKSDGTTVWDIPEALEDYAAAHQWLIGVAKINGHPIDFCEECKPVYCPICEDEFTDDWEIGSLDGTYYKSPSLLVNHCGNGHAIVIPVKTEEP